MATTDQIAFIPLIELARHIAARTLSPLEITHAYIDRIARLDGTLHAFNHVMADEALLAARTATDEILAGRHYGPLHGVPIGVKDIFDVAGVPTTAQSAFRRDRVAVRDAKAVRRLRAAGAIVLGKTATAEYAIGGTQFDLPWPPARNPWNPDRDPGNSSSGSAIAVAAGFCAGAIGSDTGGSIRSPAAWCGVAGFKPTYGAVSVEGALPFSHTLDHVGPLAWTVRDCAPMLAALAPDLAPALDASGLTDLAMADGPAKLGAIRIGVPRALIEADTLVDPQVAAALANALAALRSLGAEIRDVEIPYAACDATASLISRPEIFAAHHADLRRHPELFGAATRARIAAGENVSPRDYEAALKRRGELIVALRETFGTVDALVLPAAKTAAPELGFDTLAAGTSPYFHRGFNLTGNPALALCGGFARDGLPLSLQIVGRDFDDANVLRIGHALETVLGFRDRRPSLN